MLFKILIIAQVSIPALLWAQASSRVGILQESSNVYNSDPRESIGNSLSFEAQFPWMTDLQLLARSQGSAIRHPDAESFRFQFGPGLLYSFSWIDVALRTAFFRENGMQTSTRSQLGRSQGFAWELGWERNYQLRPRLWINWGGQWGFFSGRYHYQSEGSSQQHRGFRRSIDFGLKMSLST